ncbi:MAG TPA: hypothetical protein VFA26_15810 [Gemmataceae bacterium]|nr:hypothetical protein [Gemmataceae bacterium]
MSHIVLTEEQARTIAQAGRPVEVRDPQGNWLGRIDPKEAAIVAEVLSQRGQPQKCIPGHKVQEHLRALQAEWDRLGGFDRDYMRAFLEKLRAEDEQ